MRRTFFRVPVLRTKVLGVPVFMETWKPPLRISNGSSLFYLVLRESVIDFNRMC